MRKQNRILSMSVAVMMIAALFCTTALAASSVEDQMAANSAAWHIANAAGDKATCDKLHEANKALASQAAGSGGSSSFDSSSGSWTINDSKGNTTTSSSSSNGKTTTATYTTTSSSGSSSSSSSNSYTDESIDAYKEHGGTNKGLEDSYNNAATGVSTSGNYGDKVATTTAEAEAAVAKELLGLTDKQANQLKEDLETEKVKYDRAKEEYDNAVKNGDTATAEKAQQSMKEAHQAAEDVRGEYNYTGDSKDYDDGGYYDSTKPSGNGGYFTVSVAKTHTIQGAATQGGTIFPSGETKVKEGNNQSYTATANKGFRFVDFLVDGVPVKGAESYTFSNVNQSHTISARFEPVGVVKIGAVSIADLNGNDLASHTIKSGYGIFAKVQVTATEVSDVRVTASYNFGNGAMSATLEETADGIFEFSKNSASPKKHRCLYIPASTKDGNYTITLTITGTNAANQPMSESKTASIEVFGNMYQDDYTSDRH